MKPEDNWAVFAGVAPGDRHLLGRNDWGNLGRRVALRYRPFMVGLVVADLGERQWVARGEDGVVIIAPTANWVGVDSQAHRDALAALPPT